MTAGGTTSQQPFARYADLAGKVAVVAGTGPAVAEIAQALIGNDALVSVVAPERATVETAGVVGFAADPARVDTWERVRPHLEQRLGPIDVVVIVGDDPGVAVTTAESFVPDMAARRHGRVVHVLSGMPDAAPPTPPPGLCHVQIVTSDADPADVAAAVAFGASDTLSCAVVTLALTPTAHTP